MNKESIVLGSGDLYCMEFTGVGEALPENTAIEKALRSLNYRSR